MTCDCGDPSCPIPARLPQDISVELCDPDQSVMIIRIDGYPEFLWQGMPKLSKQKENRRS